MRLSLKLTSMIQLDATIRSSDQSPRVPTPLSLLNWSHVRGLHSRSTRRMLMVLLSRSQGSSQA